MNESNPKAPRLCLALTPGQIKALLGFLQRASLTGREVPAYAELFNLITQARPSPETAAPDQQSSL